MPIRKSLLRKLLNRYEKKQMITAEDKEESYYFREAAPVEEETQKEQEEYEILEREISPKRIKCPDCGGVTLEGLEFCDKCGGELTNQD